MNNKEIVVGILAHVDSGKTTLAEALLYKSGAINKIGRVDHKDTFLDTYSIEKSRGITIFSKQARLEMAGNKYILMDTPGHVDFSTEMERTLRILDYAILVISASTGISGYTLTLWKLLEQYKIPTFIFVNKMDQESNSKEEFEKILWDKLDSDCISFGDEESIFYERVAMTCEEAMNEFIEFEYISKENISQYIQERKLYPVYYGSALHLEGVDELIEGLSNYTKEVKYSHEFGANVFKIVKDEQGNRLTYLKITGGKLKVKELLKKYDSEGKLLWEGKINQIRLYSGSSYTMVQEVVSGMICAVTGLADSKIGEGIGNAPDMGLPTLEPVMAYQLEFLGEHNIYQCFSKLKEYQEEEPSLGFEINSRTNAIQAKVMGEVQIEVLQVVLKDRFGWEVRFSDNVIIYKESIRNKVIGIGHFEPLRHYAEVHLLIEPLERGMGIILENQCVMDTFSPNWQNLVMTHLQEITHTGVAIGAELTDVKVSLIAGAGHDKHTEGGDFREATYRALKHGLMMAESLILEPVYNYEIEVPLEYIGKVLNDMTLMEGEFQGPTMKDDVAIISGFAPVRTMSKYPEEVLSFTKGFGRCALRNGGYKEYIDSEDLIKSIDYDIYQEGIFTPDSVFCKHGAGYNVPWKEVCDYAHLDSGISFEEETNEIENLNEYQGSEELWIDQEEIDEIMGRAYKNSGKKKIPYKRKLEGPRRVTSGEYRYAPVTKKKECLLVDGYNIIFAWTHLKELASINLESATGKLLDILSNYQGVKKNRIIVVFDAYKVKRSDETIKQFHNITVVYTKEAETADGYIEKTTHELAKSYDVVVATSDVVEQLIIMGQGARKMSAKQLEEELAYVEDEIREEYLEPKKEEKFHIIGDIIQKDERFKLTKE